MTADATVVHALRRHAQQVPDRVAVRLVAHGDGEPPTDELTYGAIDRRARRFAVWLLRHCAPGDRALLAYPDSAEQVVAFLGCLYAGVVPLNPVVPVRGRPHEVERATVILRDARVSLALTEAARYDSTMELLAGAGLAAVPCAATDRDVHGDPDTWRPPAAGPETLAFLQYTSGSTGAPKGVMISHGALADNARTILALTGGRSGEVFCGWLPLHHDMGLVGQFLTPLYGGGTTVMMPPAQFVRHPLRWLRLIQRYRAGYTAAPSFALDLCCRRVTRQQAAELDLSSLSVVLDGAERVDVGTAERFLERFAVAGLHPAALKPAYGLAESTLLVTATPRERSYRSMTPEPAALARDELRPAAGAPPGAPPGAADPIAGSGTPQGARVLVVDPDTAVVLGDGRVGEIWVSGPSVASGYWANPALTEEAFAARTADGDGPFLRTGDLGAFHDGELYITGRRKDLVVVHGRNIHPGDAERLTARLHAGFSGLNGCFFAVAGRGEQPVMVQELRPSDVDGAGLPALTRMIRESLTERLGVAVRNVVLVPPGSVRRTTSGKVERAMTRELFLSGRLRIIHQDLTEDVRARCGTAAPR